MLNLRVACIFSLFQLSSFALTPAPPLDVIRIRLSNPITLKNGTTTLGLQDALNSGYTSINGTITLFPNACKQRDGTPDCTAACQDKTQMFSSLETLHNCAVFPNISVHLANNGLTANARRLAEELNIKQSNHDSSLPSHISNLIQTCLLDSCMPKPKNYRPNQLTGTQFIDNDFINICGSIQSHVNPDVGGIGVFISYIMEMALALLAFVITIPWASVANGFRTSFSYCLSALFPQRRPSRAKQHSQNSSAGSNRQSYGAFTSALVSFHKAQCWFMLATNAAGLIVEASGGLEPDSLQQLYNTYVLIKVIAIGGYLPITFTLLNLHMIKQLSWYPITLSTATIAVAITTLKLGTSDFTPTVEDFDHITSLTSSGAPNSNSCGPHNLAPLCYSPRKDYNQIGFNASSSGSSANVILALCLVTLAIILVDHFCRSDDARQQQINRRILKKLGISPSKPLFPHAGAALRFGTMAFHFVFFWLYVYCFYVFGEDLYWFGSEKIYDPSWGFGQLVAIAVWLPTLGDYLWDQIRGVRKGSEHKLPKMYEVVKRVQERRNEQLDPPPTLPVVGPSSEDHLTTVELLPYHHDHDLEHAR